MKAHFHWWVLKANRQQLQSTDLTQSLEAEQSDHSVSRAGFHTALGNWVDSGVRDAAKSRRRIELPGAGTALSILRAEHLQKTFGGNQSGAASVAALEGVDLAVERGEFVAITGASGSGKSTLLHLLGGISRPTSGSVFLEGVDLASLDDNALARVRRRRIGFVFQRYNLLAELSLVENVALPLVLDGVADSRSEEAARAALAMVGLSHRAGHRPDELSGGEQQRGAIARALVAEPAIVLADEPTGALDSVNSQRVVELLARLVAEHQQTVILVTHDPGIAAAAGRTIRMRDGRIESDQRNGTRQGVEPASGEPHAPATDAPARDAASTAAPATGASRQ